MARVVAHDIAQSLRRRIEAGEWSGGSRMPPERELAAEYRAARNTVRRAMDLLEANGAVARQVGRGTFVNGGGHPALDAIVARIAGASPADMMEIRLLIEPTAAAVAATGASAAELERVEEAHRAAIEASEMPEFERWDAELHHRIFACSRNELLKDLHNLLHVLRNQSPWFEMKKRSFTEERRQLYCREHDAIVAALRARDPEAARRAMLAHLRTVEANLLGR
jgi:DNA-binding FadR family transcriptional regulator